MILPPGTADLGSGPSHATTPLFSGIVVERPGFIEPGIRGTEHIGPEDTFDGDYGRLLERACGKGVARPAGLGLREPKAKQTSLALSGVANSPSASWRARQDSNLRPSA